MLGSPVPRRTGGAPLLCLLAAGACQPASLPVDDLGAGVETHARALAVAQTLALRPTSDLVKTNVTGVGDTTNLFRNVDDGTTFASADDSTTYVRCTSSTCTHRVAYNDATAGTVTGVVINHRVRHASATGTAQVKLYNGTTLVASGPVRNTAEAWANYSESFHGLSIPQISNLRTEMVMRRTGGTGTLRHTLVWVDVTVAPPGAPTVALTAPTAGATVRGSMLVTASASDSDGINRVDFEVDGVVRGSDSSSPYSITWKAFHETFGAHPQGAHRLSAVAHDTAGNSNRTDISVFVRPAASGDCNQDGVLSGADVMAITAEVGDGDGNNPEATPDGSFRGNPACDANEDNVVDAADQTCAQTLINQGPGACFAAGDPVVVPLVFVPTDRTADVPSSVQDFVSFKVAEARRFYARNNNGKTFRARPLEVVLAQHDQAFYWQGGNLEHNILQELQDRGYPVHLDWARFPSNRVTWVLSIGGGGWAGGRHYPTGGGFSLWGDALVFSGMDLDCTRVKPATPDDNIAATCQAWKNSGNIYGFGIGGAVHELGHGFNLPHPPDSSPDWPITVMGEHWRYAKTGLSNLDRSILAVSHFYPGFADPVSPTVVVRNPTAGATVSGDVSIRAGATDNYGVRALRLYIDDVEVPGLSPHVPFEDDWGALGLDHTWSTAGVSNGPHTIEVVAEDTSGHVVTRTVAVTVNNGGGGPVLVWPQAEGGGVSAPMQVGNDAAASGGQFVQVAAGSNSTAAPPSTGRAAIAFTVGSAGSYRVWGRVIAPGTGDDSFWVRMDGGAWIKWNEIALGSTWHWDEVHDSDQGNQIVSFDLAAGSHTMEVAYREDGTRLDRLLITSDPSFVPTGTGP